jgi:putative Holliday junction resolvase
VAVSDDDRLVVTPHRTVHRSGHRPDEHAELAEVVADAGAVGVIVGLPLSLDGSMGPAAKNVLSEVKALRKVIAVPIEAWDERLSTVTAEQQLTAGGVRGPRRREVVDQLAAAVILQAWIDAAAHPRRSGPGTDQ